MSYRFVKNFKQSVFICTALNHFQSHLKLFGTISERTNSVPRASKMTQWPRKTSLWEETLSRFRLHRAVICLKHNKCSELAERQKRIELLLLSPSLGPSCTTCPQSSRRATIQEGDWGPDAKATTDHWQLRRERDNVKGAAMWNVTTRCCCFFFKISQIFHTGLWGRNPHHKILFHFSLQCWQR